jgi:hypothetical protein
MFLGHFGLAMAAKKVAPVGFGVLVAFLAASYFALAWWIDRHRELTAP